ncbi:MAG: O-antigen ligase family protein [Patescibacteria group bacterium]|nr:O-antigen ligase family protein [Patescibacteria group bacterium]
MKKLNLKIKYEWSLIFIFLSIPLIIIAQLPILLSLVAMFFAIIFFVGINWPKLGLFLFIFFRPAVDFLYQYRLETEYSFNFTSLFAILTIAFCLLTIIRNYRELPKFNTIWTWLIFLFIGGLSIFYTINRGATIDEFSRLVSIFLLFVNSYLLLKTPKDLTNLIRVIIYSAAIPVLVGFWQLYFEAGMIEEGTNRILGTFAHPNMLAYFLILPITLATFAALNLGKKRIESYGYSILSLIFVLVLAFTYTRGAYVALALIFLIVGLVKFRAFLLAAASLAFAFYLVIPPITARVNSLINFDPYGSIGWRITLWTDSISYFREKPWSGNGLGTGPLVIAENRDFKLGATEPHNDYLKIGLENGAIGLLVYLSIILSVLIDFYRSFKKQNKPRLKMLSLFSSACLIALSIMSFGDNILNDTALQWSLWTLFGSILANNYFRKKDLKAE